jgi:uncharacterized protein with von Willebrand factor type A (vWA) domain
VSSPAASRALLFRGVDRAALVAALVRRLGRAGVEVGLLEAQALTRALESVRPDRVADLYWPARITLVRRHDDLAVFDAVFAAVFSDAVLGVDPHARRTGDAPAPPGDAFAPVPGADAPESEDGEGLPWVTLPPAPQADAGEPDGELLLPERLPSRLAALADVPFAELDDADLAVLGRWLEDSRRWWPRRRSRRQAVHHAGSAIALRPTAARARRTGWEPVHLVRTRAVQRPRRLVVVCDVSQSMQAYTRVYLHLMRASVLTTDSEVYAFATTLTRLTATLRHRSTAVALEQATERVGDRFGGTRIATNLQALMASHRGNALRGAVVVVASDGWDTDPPEQLAVVMARLRRRAHAVLWLNPRAAAPGYQPLVGAMAAALPHCDAFLPAADLRGLHDVLAAVRDTG